MDIYDFFNSRDAANYCRNIGYTFTAIEKAYLICHSYKHTLAEKHMAWQTIIDTMADEPLPENPWVNDSLHSFLRSVINLQNSFIQEFATTKGEYIYSASNLNVYSEHRFVGNWFFNNYIACLNSVKNTISESQQEIIKICRYDLHSSPILALDDDEVPDPDGCDALILDEKLSVLDLDYSARDYDDDDNWYYLNPSFLLDEMPLAIPTPFSKGDIVEDAGIHPLCRENSVPFVIEGYPLMPVSCNGITKSRRAVKGLAPIDECNIQWHHGSDYLDLIGHEVKDGEQILHSVSEYLRGSISAEILMRRHQEYFEMRPSNNTLEQLIDLEEHRRRKHEQRE